MIRIPFLTPRKDPVAALYGDIVAAARSPLAYREFGVSDDFEGRFERLALITTLVLRRLKALPAPSEAMAQELVAQELVDRLFSALDEGLRLMGVSDLSVGKKIKKLAQGFYGRAGAYTAALEAGGEAELRATLSRNLFGGKIAPEAVADGLLAEIAALNTRLDAASLEALLAGAVLSAHYRFSGTN